MQRKRKRTEISVETEEFIIRRGGDVARGWCSCCGASVLVADIEGAARVANVALRVVTLGVESGQVHHWESAGGRWMLCLSSLLRWIDSNPTQE
jgi:hypothetical protein